jgi:hypothetical protein
LHAAFANKTVSVTSKSDNGETESERIALPKWWLTRRNRQTYDGMLFDAKVDNPNFINLWRGFGVKEEAAGAWNLLRDHIRDNIADGDPDSDAYILRWLAWAAQNPTLPAEVALVLFSPEKGTGKGMLGRAMCRLFGSHGLHISQRSHLVGKFNAHLAQTDFLFADEVFWPGDPEGAGVIKAIITEPTLMLERKGVDPIPMRNALKVFLASNEPWIVPASGDERRYAVFQVDSSRKQDGAYFGAIQRQLDNGGLGAMLYDLRRMGLKGWHPREDIPQTEALAEQKVRSAPPEIELLGDILAEGCLPGQHGKPNQARAGWLYDHGRKSAKGLQWWSDHRFATFFKKMGARRKRSNGAVWVFPPLAEMRARFRTEMPWWPPFDAEITEWEADFDDE